MFQYVQTKICLRGKIFQYPHIVDYWRASVGGGLASVMWVGWVLYLSRFRTNMGGVSGVLAMLLLLLLLLFEYYPDGQNVGCLFLKQKRKNIPSSDLKEPII